MPLSQRWTLTRYLIEERRRFPQASGRLNGLILDVSLACKSIARVVAQGRLDADGDDAERLDRLAHEIFLRHNEWNGHLAGVACDAVDEPWQIPAGDPRGPYLLVFDALDGTGSLDCNVSVGSIFSILRAPADAVASGRDATAADFLQAGATQVAAGYALYGPTTMFVLSVGNGVAGFTLNPNLGEFMLTHPELRVPAETQEFAIDTSNSRFWEPPIKRYVEECEAGRAGPRGKDFNMRWVASTVAEVHRILMRGGVFIHPHGSATAGAGAPGGEPALAEARGLRLLCEASPIGFLVEQAGGRASTGRQPVLGVVPRAIGQRIGLVFGSKSEVERIELYHREPSRPPASPLFAARGLFRE
ncbi:MAG TPA: class 1 fructose-bisphosphatase [Methylibium sp.]|uniref:class 1 fructose-bisphosphatase n=1 Tax=Methylibium sp. TaxID=2067992 RepID=UPI002DBE8DFB|nr:class 1 fructose-bisphosphatase [Methylibium sp.]HEU4458329.1 class 1 fructose-bisphosphatase [Methylibium sp.]